MEEALCVFADADTMEGVRQDFNAAMSKIARARAEPSTPRDEPPSPREEVTRVWNLFLMTQQQLARKSIRDLARLAKRMRPRFAVRRQSRTGGGVAATRWRTYQAPGRRCPTQWRSRPTSGRLLSNPTSASRPPARQGKMRLPHHCTSARSSTCRRIL